MGHWPNNAYQLCIRTLADSLAALSQKLASARSTVPCRLPFTAQSSLLAGVALLAAICPGSGPFCLFQLVDQLDDWSDLPLSAGQFCRPSIFVSRRSTSVQGYPTLLLGNLGYQTKRKKERFMIEEKLQRCTLLTLTSHC